MASADSEEAADRLVRARTLVREGLINDALVELRTALAMAPQNARLQNEIGDSLARIGRNEEAESAFRQAITLAPDAVDARYNLGVLRAALGDFVEAATQLEMVCQLRPDIAVAWLQLGGVLNNLGRYFEARVALERHVGLTPTSAVGWTWLGAARQFLGLFDAAEAAYRHAITLDHNQADAHSNLGRLLQTQGKPDEARCSLDTALAIDPGHSNARAGLAALLDNEGQYEDALAVALGPEGRFSMETLAAGARILRHLGRHTQAQEVLQQALKLDGLPVESAVQLRYSMGHVLDEAGDTVRAAAFFVEANRLQQGRFGKDTAAYIEAVQQTIDDLIRVFDTAAMQTSPNSGCDSTKPLFIIGLPRAGKSIVEQILSSHPAVWGAGELTDIGEIAVGMGRAGGGWPQGLKRLSRGELADSARHYLERLEQLAPGAERVTDTMPFNYLHVGLINLLFPRARVVHCVRNPADLALRCYMKNFAGRSLSFASDLDHIADYLTGYRRLVHHWLKVGRIASYIVRYEDLVLSPDDTIRALVDFAGLPWDERCLRFFEAGVAKSASDTPVRRPLENREIDAWRAYEPLIAGCLSRLDLDAYASNPP